MNVGKLAHFDSPIFRGLAPDAPVPGGMLEAFNCYSIDSGNALRSKCLGRFIETEENQVSDGDIAWYGAQFFEYVCANGNKYLVADHGNAVYMAQNNTTTSGEIEIGTWTEVIAPAGDAVQSSYTIFRNVCVRVNGVADNSYFDQNGTVKTIALTPPAAAPVVANTTGGSVLPGTYAIYYCYVKNNGTSSECRSNPSAMATVTVTDNAINVTTVASAESGVDAIIIFRSLYNSSTIVEAVTISNSSTTTKLTADDDSIRFNDAISFNWVKPPKVEYVAVGANRLWLIDNDTCRAYFTQENSVEQFGAYNYTTDFDREDGDEITGVVAMKNYIFVFKRNKVFAISMTTGFPVTVIDKNDGCVNGRTIAVDEENNAIIFLSATGVKIITITAKGDLTENKIWRTMVLPDIVNMTDPMQCFGSYSRASGCYHLYYSSGSSPSEAKHYVCSLKYSGINTGAWFMFDEKYSLDPDDEGYKFYSFGILTDNAGLPFMCAPANRTTSDEEVRFFQIDDLAPLAGITGFVSIGSYIGVHDELALYRGSTFPDGSDDNAIYFGSSVKLHAGDVYGLPKISRIGKDSWSVVFDILDYDTMFSIDTTCDAGKEPVQYYVYGDYFYFYVEVINTDTLAEKTVIGKVSRTDYEPSVAASIPTGAIALPKISYELDLDYFVNVLGYEYDSDTGIISYSSGGVEYGANIGDYFETENLITSGDRAFLGPLPHSMDWCVYLWSNPK